MRQDVIINVGYFAGIALPCTPGDYSVNDRAALAHFLQLQSGERPQTEGAISTFPALDVQAHVPDPRRQTGFHPEPVGETPDEQAVIDRFLAHLGHPGEVFALERFQH